MQPLRHRCCHPRARDCAHYADAFGSWFSREHLPVQSHVCPPHDSTPPPGAFRGRACVRLVLLNFSDSVYFVPPPPPFPNFWASALCISFSFFLGHWAERFLFCLPVRKTPPTQSHSLQRLFQKKVSQISMELGLISLHPPPSGCASPWMLEFCWLLLGRLCKRAWVNLLELCWLSRMVQLSLSESGAILGMFGCEGVIR